MNNVFTAKLLQNLNNKKGNKGFTLIELLVVVIIIGVLAAVALPNLLGQVGKARESEAKSALGALNRAQQAFHLESRVFFPGTDAAGANQVNGTDSFAQTESALGVVPGGDFYQYTNTTDATGNANAANSSMIAVATNPDNDGARDFAAGMNYTTGNFDSTLCVATIKSAGAARTPAAAVAAAGVTPANLTGTVIAVPAAAGAGTCTSGNTIE